MKISPFVLFVSLLAFMPVVARGQVDCSDPNFLCTGDPCVIPRIQPADPCIVDFGARDVVIEGLFGIGEVSFTAKSFVVEGSIGGRQDFPVSPTLDLSASQGVVLNGAIRLTTFNNPLWVRIVAGGSIEANAPIVLVATLASTAPAETVLLDAGADLVVRGAIRDTLGKGSLPVTLRAGGRLDLLAALRLQDDDLLLDAGTDLVIDGPTILKEQLDITAVAGGSIEVLDKVRTAGGAVSLEGAVDVLIRRGIRSRKVQGPAAGSCLGLTLRSTAGNVLLDDSVECSGRHDQGPLTVEANGDITVNDRIRTKSSTSEGGAVSLTSSSGTVSINSAIDSRGETGGDVTAIGARVEVASVAVDSRGREPNFGHHGGFQHFEATAGDLLLDGRFLATDNAAIEGSATGNLTASGVFAVGSNGCIGLSAGGTLDTSGGSFDQPITPSCP